MRKFSVVSKGLTSLSLTAAIVAAPLTLTTSATAVENTPNAAAVSQLSCGEPNIVLAMDETWSFGDNEQNQKAEGIKAFLKEYAKIPNAKVTMYHFGQMSPAFNQILTVNLSDEGLCRKLSTLC